MWCVWCLWWAALWAAWGGGGARALHLSPRPECAPQYHQSCEVIIQDGQSYTFSVNSEIYVYKLTDDGIFTLECSSWSTIALDVPALPRYQPALRVSEVRLQNCWRRAVSYAAALRALNVLGAPSSGDGTAPPTYFIDLELSRVENFNASLLAGTPNLRSLSISQTTVTATELELLPAGLERLYLYDICRVTTDVLARLTNLSELEVADLELVVVEVETARNLSSLVARSHATRVSLSLPDTLKRLELSGWAPRRPEPWRSCAGLDSLYVSYAVAETLPDGWLALCARLRTLRLDDILSLTSLPAGALRGAAALQVVHLEGCGLETLPAGLLDDARALRVLDLKRNRLHTLPGELFRRSNSLSEVDLAYNNLNGSVLDALETVSSLNELRLDVNPALDACPLARDVEHGAMRGSSSFRALRNLTVLSLIRTDTRRVCPDWRQLPRLERLDLSSNDVTQLKYTDLLFNTTVNITVSLSSIAPSLHREEYESVAAAPAGPTLTLNLWGSLRCDCELYWTAAALRLPNTRLREDGARCDDSRALRDVPLDELVCAAPDHCPAGCACSAHEDVARAGRVLRLDCAGAPLRRVPRVDTRAALRYTDAEPVELDLHLAGNRISRLAPEDLPPELLTLDLRQNLLGLIDAATVTALVSRAGRRVWLAGNPLECDCNTAALAAVREHPDVFRDWANMTCSDGTPLTLVSSRCGGSSTSGPGNVAESMSDNTIDGILHYITTPAPQSKDVSEGMSVGAVTAVALGAAVATALVLVLARAALRRRRLGLRARAESMLRLERLDAGDWLYDAFLSFAHADWAVVSELVERLESGAAPLRLCMHYRDWVPGGWIPAQIAQSVRISRRTVAVVSEAFMRSKWARAEFREAYAAALEDNEPRLVLVLLEDPARFQLDSELHAYVTGNTYVRWGDPWFWQKLRNALPAPLPRQPADSPAASPSPPLDLEPMLSCA